MKLIVTGSSSKGNGYALIGTSETLLLEAGIKFNETNIALGFNTRSVVGALVTHIHQDHAKYIGEFAGSGIDVYAHKHTFGSKTSHRFHEVEHKKAYKIGSFIVTPLNVVHDVPTFSYLIFHPECGNLFFCTDTHYVPYNFTDLNNILIEANYSVEIANENIENGAPKSVRDRVLFSHMEINTLVEFLRNSNTKSLNNIVLLHLSAGNSHAENFLSTVRDVLPGKNVWIADKGLQINIDKTPF